MLTKSQIRGRMWVGGTLHRQSARMETHPWALDTTAEPCPVDTCQQQMACQLVDVHQSECKVSD